MGLFGRKKEAPETAEIAPGPDATDKKPGIFRRLTRALSRTMSSMFGGLRDAVFGRKIDEDVIEAVYDVLIKADMGPDLADQVCERLRQAWKRKEIENGDEIIPFLKNDFKTMLAARGNAVKMAPKPPTVILVVGVNGTGKTTSIGKLSWWFKQQGKKVLIAAGDTFRAAAESQLRIWAEERVGVDFHQGDPNSHPAAVAFTAAERAVAEGHEVLIIDTAGRLHTEKNLMQQLEKIHKSVAKIIPDAPHEVILVLDANVGLNALAQAENFQRSAAVTGLFLAKLDSTGKGGAVLQIHQKFDIPVKFVGLGEQKEDLAPFDAEQFVDAMFSQETATGS